MNRREFSARALLGMATGLVAPEALSRAAHSQPYQGFSPQRHVLLPSAWSTPVGDGTLSVFSDGHLQLPASSLQREGVSEADLKALLGRYQLTGDAYTPDCNISVWQQGDRTVLFDVGGGSQFMDTVGQLPSTLEDAGIDPESVTDIILTHAHPDHLWGLLDDFDDILYANATIHIHQDELAYWLADDTLGKTPEDRQSFVVGAQSRLARADDQLSVFKGGDEVLPGIEAVETRGHTPGHTSFALHQGGDSVLIVGDALSNVALSFEYPRLPSGSDQNPELAIKTRLALLDRASNEKMRLIGFHLPTPGFGRIERQRDEVYHFLAEEGL